MKRRHGQVGIQYEVQSSACSGCRQRSIAEILALRRNTADFHLGIESLKENARLRLADVSCTGGGDLDRPAQTGPPSLHVLDPRKVYTAAVHLELEVAGFQNAGGMVIAGCEIDARSPRGNLKLWYVDFLSEVAGARTHAIHGLVIKHRVGERQVDV